MRSAELGPRAVAGPVPSPTVVAVVLAGGESRRFGADKLAAELAGRTVLDTALDGLPAGISIGVVGPDRRLERPVTMLREEPPGGGPAAGLVAGLRWALAQGADVIVTLPGDAPEGGRAARLLVDALTAAAQESAVTSVVGVDAGGRDQVLQLALRPAAAEQLVTLAGPGGGHGQSVRRLVTALDPPPRQLRLPADLVRDVDTPDQLNAVAEHFRNRRHT